MAKELLDLAKDVALEAGNLLKSGFGSTFVINNKEGINNLVTEYDNRAEELIINRISKEYPTHSFLAEESGVSNLNNNSSEISWVIDPLDGTVNFANNLPIFSVSIAAVQNGEVLAGVIYHPILDQMFYASHNTDAFVNDTQIKVSTKSDFGRSFLVTGFPYNIEENKYNCIKNFVDIISKGIPVRRLGSAALDLAYVASGIFDGFWEIKLNPWDVAAGILIVERAGGKVTDYFGNRFSIFDQSMIASNGLIHPKILEILTEDNDSE